MSRWQPPKLMPPRVDPVEQWSVAALDICRRFWMHFLEPRDTGWVQGTLRRPCRSFNSSLSEQRRLGCVPQRDHA